jgi:hypothetical protein
MKPIIVFVVCIVFAAGVGWYCGKTGSATREGQLLMQESEDDNAIATVYDIAAIRLIESGETQKSMRSLSVPIARYYYLYAIHAGTNEDRLKLLAQIEQLMRTNQVVANEITNQMANYEIHGKLPNYGNPK